MPGARESLLDAACTALGRMPWSKIRMVDVAVAAGTSRQTLYNEFGSKDGLGRALVRRAVDTYLAGVDRVLTTRAHPAERLVALAEWTVGTAADDPLVRAVLTGLWPRRLPSLALSAVRSVTVTPAQRRADGALPSPADLLDEVCERAVAAFCGPASTRFEAAEHSRRCDLTMRLALSCLLVPAEADGTGRLIRGSLPGPRSRTGY